MSEPHHKQTHAVASVKRAGNESELHHSAKLFISRLIAIGFNQLPNTSGSTVGVGRQTKTCKYDGVWMEYPLHAVNCGSADSSSAQLPVTCGSATKRRALLNIADDVMDAEGVPIHACKNLHNIFNPNLRCKERRAIRTRAKKLGLLKVVDVAVVRSRTVHTVIEVVMTSKMTRQQRHSIMATYPKTDVIEVKAADAMLWLESLEMM
jgi:hypothetical protein